ncbi:OmpA family protein [Phenylobacterium sp.]|uniref:OmpA family protein n=1 Tax=Phenylobacterium sp. TaxID=1871053 RepID=UPI0011F4376B|nr:OmpA family protein [Phenylobacterium sp.]THD60410.1 MAG: OmpA family protein [Phenylobacterium sp.]
MTRNGPAAGSAIAAIGLSLALGLSGCATTPAGRERIVRAPVRCADQTVQIYFEPQSAEVTKEGRAVIAAAAAQARPCKVASVEVLGLTDAVGAADANLELSKRRAQSVTAALAAAGVPVDEFKLTALGEAGATTADGRARPLRRRADIVLHLSPT